MYLIFSIIKIEKGRGFGGGDRISVFYSIFYAKVTAIATTANKVVVVAKVRDAALGGGGAEVMMI